MPIKSKGSLITKRKVYRASSFDFSFYLYIVVQHELVQHEFDVHVLTVGLISPMPEPLPTCLKSVASKWSP